MAHRRRIVMFNRVTADGYFAGANGSLDWVVPDAEVDRAGAQATPAFDTILLGRRTYQLFEAFWPHALDNSPASQDPHDPRRLSPEMRAMALMLNEGTKLVFSRTLKDVTWKNSRLLPEFQPKEIEALKRQPGKDIIIFGSGSIVSQLTRYGLIDEYQFVVSPILLGEGRPAISDLAKRLTLDLCEAQAYPSGNVMLRYAHASNGGSADAAISA